MEWILVALAFLTGFFGDILLQTGAKMGLGGATGWGLNEYFAQHGAAEATCIAGGMMALFYILILPLIKKNDHLLNLFYLAIYGIILDFIFRKMMIFSSLKGYYIYFNYFWSAVWGAIPLILPYLIYLVILSNGRQFN
jgi:hypothetical protein